MLIFLLVDECPGVTVDEKMEAIFWGSKTYIVNRTDTQFPNDLFVTKNYRWLILSVTKLDHVDRLVEQVSNCNLVVNQEVPFIYVDYPVV